MCEHFALSARMDNSKSLDLDGEPSIRELAIDSEVAIAEALPGTVVGACQDVSNGEYCRYCSRKFAHVKQTHHHEERNCEFNPSIVKCAKCFRRYARWDSLKRHESKCKGAASLQKRRELSKQNTAHNATDGQQQRLVLKNQCRYCGEMFPRNQFVHIHERKCAGRPYIATCRGCLRQYTRH